MKGKKYIIIYLIVDSLFLQPCSRLNWSSSLLTAIIKTNSANKIMCRWLCDYVRYCSWSSSH